MKRLPPPHWSYQSSRNLVLPNGSFRRGGGKLAELSDIDDTLELRYKKDEAG
jgi:hypothetical protein